MQLDLALSHILEFHEQWDRTANDESKRRARFAQHSIAPEVVAAELNTI